jgi:2-hydroxy-3-oxopropionate reductase
MAINLRNDRIAVIGLGAIGLPMAINLATKGRSVQVWNRSDSAPQKAVTAGATRISNLNEIDAAIVLTVLPNMPQVQSVLELGLLDALHPGDLLVVMGTVSPIAIQKLGVELSTRGIHLLDAPVSGGDVGAQRGTLSIMVGGDPEVLAAVEPTFQLIGTTVKHLGPLGAGETTKACNQIVVAATLTALAEAVTLGRRAGLDTKVLLDVLAGGLANSQVLTVKREKIESDNYAPGGSAVFQLKDLRIALEVGKSLGSALPVTEQVTKLFDALIQNGDGELDHSAIVREIERRSN